MNCTLKPLSDKRVNEILSQIQDIRSDAASMMIFCESDKKSLFDIAPAEKWGAFFEHVNNACEVFKK